jgi:pimeloyl-ACP methyl ester carboxylesterase
VSRLPPTLPPALPGEIVRLSGAVGPLAVYTHAPASPADTRPLLLIHSINAAASACEVRPLYEHFRMERPVYAPDLPGYGLSDRSARRYTPRLMTDAIHAVLALIRERHGAQPVDALAVSLSCEFLARAASEAPSAFRTVALVSPTAFNRTEARRGLPGSDRGMPWLYRLFTTPLWSEAFFNLLTSRASIRFFLQKTWGSKDIDEGLLEYDYLTARQPGACNAPYFFVSGYLFSGDANALYESLSVPVWMCHGTRGDFTDYRWKAALASRRNWSFQAFEGGALPHFEQPARFISAYRQFLDTCP